MKKKNKMTANKEENVPIISHQSRLSQCCCMCGDSGLTHELFQCTVCHFRSQHRYCSNLYPKADSYEVCNWCLNQKADSKSQNSSNSSPSCKDNSEDDGKNQKKGDQNHGNHNNPKLQFTKKYSTGKPKSPEKRPPSTARKRIISNARLEEQFRTTMRKSEEISKGGHITRHVFRNKVRRYKLLDEVSS
ncbi:hypothetical protein Golob_010902 [Gossypium lobatum]|uniref:PHD-type zinc finger plants domain-containing protein n=1 Tax=Gossypium lobatum TaxID=34289 RepID=A0A7J8MN86_9ROSI|nr:hypothetical protein [Gossypium lobatum]